MKTLQAIILCGLLSGCAGPIAAWKGRAYGEHSINPNTLVTMSGTFRTGRTSSSVDGRILLCLDPFPEVAGMLGGSSEFTGRGIGLKDGATPVFVKGHDSSTKYQEASLAYTIACNERINGVFDQPEYKQKVEAILTYLLAPSPAADAAGKAKQP